MLGSLSNAKLEASIGSSFTFCLVSHTLWVVPFTPLLSVLQHHYSAGERRDMEGPECVSGYKVGRKQSFCTDTDIAQCHPTHKQLGILHLGKLTKFNIRYYTKSTMILCWLWPAIVKLGLNWWGVVLGWNETSNRKEHRSPQSFCFLLRHFAATATQQLNGLSLPWAAFLLSPPVLHARPCPGCHGF